MLSEIVVWIRLMLNYVCEGQVYWTMKWKLSVFHHLHDILSEMFSHNNFLHHNKLYICALKTRPFLVRHFADRICYVLCLLPWFSWTTILPPYESKVLLLRAQQLTRGANQVHPVYTITNLLIFTQLFHSLLSSSLSLVDTFLYYS